MPGEETQQQLPLPSNDPSPQQGHVSPAPYYGAPAYGYGSYGPAYGGTYGEESGFLGEITVSRILRILRKKWLTLLLSTLFGLCAAFFYLSRITPIYSAYSLIEMSVRKPRILSREGAVLDEGSFASREEIVTTRLAKFRGSRMAEIAAREFAKIRPDDPMPSVQLERKLRKGVSFGRDGNTLLVTVSFSSPDPRFAADAANAYAAAAEEAVVEENTAVSDNAVAWLQQQAVVQRELLASKEKELADFRTQNNIDVLDGEMKSEDESIRALSTSKSALDSQIVMLEESLNTLNGLDMTARTAATLPPDLPRQEQISAALDSWLTVTQERGALLKRYTEEHPEIKALDLKIENNQKRVIDELETAKASLRNQVSLLKLQQERLAGNILGRREKLTELERTIVSRKIQLTAMERERDAADITYRGILKRIEEARLSADENTAVVKVLERSSVPGRPVYPNRPRAWILGLLLGLVVGCVLAMVTDNLEDRVTGFEDIENYIGIKVLGIVPHVLSAKRKDLALGTLNHKFSQLSEAFAGIRTMLSTMQIRDTTRCTLIASAAPEEGKTITSCNLAIASAKAGRRTLLVDFDMRRPRLRGIFADPGEDQSLLHALDSRDRSLFDRLPLPTDCDNLEIITSHPSEDISPAEILGGEVVGDFFDWAKSRYERIIIDSPPYGAVSDAAVLADYVGGIVLVCRPEKSRRRASRHAVRQFTEIGARVLGCVVNDVDFRRSGWFGDYDYRGSYYHYRGTGCTGTARNTSSSARKLTEPRMTPIRGDGEYSIAEHVSAPICQIRA